MGPVAFSGTRSTFPGSRPTEVSMLQTGIIIHQLNLLILHQYFLPNRLMFTCRQQGLYICLVNNYFGGVTKLDQESHCMFVNISNRDFRLPRLCQLSSEHGSEVWAAS